MKVIMLFRDLLQLLYDMLSYRMTDYGNLIHNSRVIVGRVKNS